MPLLYVFLSLLALLLTKKKMTADFSRFVHRLGGSQHTAIVIWSLIFLPGTLIHEVSHFLVAALTGARTGKIEIFPEYLEDDESGKVVLGSVQTQKLNPLQGFFVGLAPFISGLALLIWLASLLQADLATPNYWLLFFEGYLFFTIANSFFPSWPDIRQTLPFVIISLVAAFLAWYFGFQIFLNSNSYIWPILTSLWRAIALSAALNLALIATLSLFHKITPPRS